MDLAVIYEDNHLLVVNKPAGLLAQGDRSGDTTLTAEVAAYLKQRYDKPGNVYVGLVHRLDRNVSGVMVLARTSKAAARLATQFRDGTVRKTYLAVVQGQPVPPRGELVSWLAAAGDAHGVTRTAATPFAGAREGRLRYDVLEVAEDFALVAVEPITGRRHQIRAQLAGTGAPLVGDVKYGSAVRLPQRRLALHASGLEIRHPVGGRALEFNAPLPADWPWPVPDAKVRKP